MSLLLKRNGWRPACSGLWFLLVASSLFAQAPPSLTGPPFSPPAMFEAPVYQPTLPASFPPCECPWTWTFLPESLLFRSYLGGPKEPRLTSAWLYESHSGWLWELEIGARVGLLRFGSPDGTTPEGWQVDLWGAAFPRLNMEHKHDLAAADFSVGIPLTWREGPWQTKFEIRHLSSHLGDEFLLRNPGYPRLNYVRDAFAAAVGYFPEPNLRLYAEAEYAFNRDGGSEPWHLQFGVDFSPQPIVCCTGWSGSPFAAINGQLREEVDFGGGLNIVAGWQWWGPDSERLLRLGLQYYNGKSYQFSFYDQHEQLLGVGLWYDY